jgi:hypothetical protein
MGMKVLPQCLLGPGLLEKALRHPEMT